MIKELNLVLSPAEAADTEAIIRSCSKISQIDISHIAGFRYLRKSIDARRGNIRVNLTVEFWTEGDQPDSSIPEFRWQDVSKSREVLIIGSGPAGLFAALELITLGLKPVILERGKDVSLRKVDIAKISRKHIVDPDSNYCFGEGGAGTYSDGKLYTRSKKRGDNRKILELLCFHGADESILYEAHPHIGTDKLPAVISAIRETITRAGGVFMFKQRVNDLLVTGDRISGVSTLSGESYKSENVILATGHSARDIYELLYRKSVAIEAKSFAMGVRVEHPQELINSIQYHGTARGKYLPAATYSLVHQSDGRGVYSFCMCPGGFIVPSATAANEVVVNGMSPSHRNSPYANSGIVVEIRPEDIPVKDKKSGALGGLSYQSWLEREAYSNSNQSQAAPAQRLSDFMASRISADLPDVSYFPGVVSSPLHQWLPDDIGIRLKDAFKQFNLKMRGFVTGDAVITGVESRSSSPIRILRDPETLEHISLRGLYPAGEGSGYSGGILSSAVDGIRVAQAIALKMKLS